MRSTLLAAVAALAAGCGGPVVTVRHSLAPDLPVPAGASLFVGEVALASGEGDSYGPFVAAALAEQLAAQGRTPADSAEAAQLVISAKLFVQTSESRGTRTIRRFDPQQRRTEALDAPTLSRTAAVRADFVVTDARAARPVAAAETRQAYDSADDPRTRGPLGLDRADAPDHLPATDTIVRELLAACVETFAEMIRPREVVARLPLRGTLSAEGRRGLAAAGREDFAEAVRHLAAAVEAEPGSADLRFNLAACAEAAGKLETALAGYEAAGRHSGGRDRHAAEAARRVRRVLARRPK